MQTDNTLGRSAMYADNHHDHHNNYNYHHHNNYNIAACVR
jgi:hypothetical protein